jgi:hypothetical protein
MADINRRRCVEGMLFKHLELSFHYPCKHSRLMVNPYESKHVAIYKKQILFYSTTLGFTSLSRLIYETRRDAA